MSEWKICKSCNSSKLLRDGKQYGIQRYKCKDCASVFRGEGFKIQFRL